jgi:hypothetical protein
MNKKALLISAIELFESGKTDLIATIREINNLTGRDIDEYSLRNYWTSTSLEDFCNTLLTEPIYNWEGINDEQALQLIKEMLDNLSNDGILERNGEALEKRYNKTTGFLTGLIFHSDIVNESEILEQLKKETRFFL